MHEQNNMLMTKKIILHPVGNSRTAGGGGDVCVCECARMCVSSFLELKHIF